MGWGRGREEAPGGRGWQMTGACLGNVSSAQGKAALRSAGTCEALGQSHAKYSLLFPKTQQHAHAHTTPHMPAGAPS